LDKTAVGLGSVENTALSTWAGSVNITTLGTIGTGTWNATTIGTTKGGTGLTSIGTANQVLGVNAGASALEYKTISGTSNQVLVANAANSITLSTPQNINTGASPTFAGLTLSGLSTGIVHSNSSGVLSSSAINLASADVTGILGVSNGGTGLSTFGGTNTVLYTTSANTLASITTANNGILVTNSSGVPSISTTLPAGIMIGAGSGSATPIIGGALYSNATTVNNTAGTDTVITSYSMPANTLSTDNAGIHIKAWGTTAANSNSKAIYLYFGNTIVASISANASGKPWYLDAYVLRKTATTQTSMGMSQFHADTTVAVSNTAPAETLTGAVTIKTTATSGTIGNIVQTGIIVEYIGQ
jgi:hypothetical protein